MTFLINKTLLTLHFVSNTIIDASQGATVRGKSSMLVLLHNAYSEEPEFDYSATLKAEFAKGADNIWRFSRLTLLTDSSAVSTDGVSARQPVKSWKRPETALPARRIGQRVRFDVATFERIASSGAGTVGGSGDRSERNGQL